MPSAVHLRTSHPEQTRARFRSAASRRRRQARPTLSERKHDSLMRRANDPTEALFICCVAVLHPSH